MSNLEKNALYEDFLRALQDSLETKALFDAFLENNLNFDSSSENRQFTPVNQNDNLDPDFLRQLEEEYLSYVTICNRVLRHIKTSLGDYREEIEISGERSPIASIEDRTKTFSSTMEKCGRKGYPKNIQSIMDNVQDVAGIRIITVFRNDIFKVADILKTRLRLNVTITKDYVNHPKANGYRSLHLIVKREFFFMGETYYIPVEIQIRTKAMDLWATAEHILKYKNPNPNPETAKRLKKAADILAAFDDTITELQNKDSELQKQEQSTEQTENSTKSSLETHIPDSDSSIPTKESCFSRIKAFLHR